MKPQRMHFDGDRLTLLTPAERVFFRRKARSYITQNVIEDSAKTDD